VCGAHHWAVSEQSFDSARLTRTIVYPRNKSEGVLCSQTRWEARKSSTRLSTLS
jgi:hypothetical protein